MYINTFFFIIYNKYTLVTQFGYIKNSAGILHFMLSFDCVSHTQKTSFVFQHILQMFPQETKSASPILQCTLTSIKEFSPLQAKCFHWTYFFRDSKPSLAAAFVHNHVFVMPQQHFSVLVVQHA